MNKLILVVVVTLSMISVAGATDIIITVPDAAVPQVIAAIKQAHPNTECAEWDLATVTCVKQKYTDIQWVKKIIRDMVRDIVLSGQTQIINNAYAAKQAELKQAEAVKITMGEQVDNYVSVK